VELLRLSFALAKVDELADFVHEQSADVLISGNDADTVIVAGSLKDRWAKPIGVWLEVSPGYPAQLAARDVATLSWLIELDHVVVSAGQLAEAHADVVRALLTNDEVNFTNEVVSLVKAYNRPAPPRPLKVWSFDGSTLRHEGDRMSLVSTSSMPVGELARFA
jgi:hypothetical protein